MPLALEPRILGLQNPSSYKAAGRQSCMEWLQLVEFVEIWCWWSKVDRRLESFGRSGYSRLSPHEGSGEAKPPNGVEKPAQCMWLLIVQCGSIGVWERRLACAGLRKSSHDRLDRQFRQSFFATRGDRYRITQHTKVRQYEQTRQQIKIS